MSALPERPRLRPGLAANADPELLKDAVDQLVPLSGGEATAAAIPGARLLVLDQMAHDLPESLWPQAIDAIAQVAGVTAAS